MLLLLFSFCCVSAVGLITISSLVVPPLPLPSFIDDDDDVDELNDEGNTKDV